MVRRTNGAGAEFFPGFSRVAEIGVGRFAIVYRARETATGRLVALKLPKLRPGSAESVESFEREAIALGAVGSHPHIVTFFRSSETADGRPALVLELCRGSAAEQMAVGAGLSVAEVLAIGEKIAGALSTVHRAGMLHRDVKPQNILVTEFGEPALADFGTARLAALPRTGTALFDRTTSHVAPELLGDRETSPATDVYQLASSLRELLGGRAVGDELTELLLRAMSKAPADRPQTAAEFAAELLAAAAHRPPDLRLPDAAAPKPMPPAVVREYPIPPIFSDELDVAPAVPTWSARGRAPDRDRPPG